jgi:hypothetical protein
MGNKKLAARGAGVAACLAASALLGASPALAKVPGENIFGAGSTLQAVAQQNVWIPAWNSTATDQSTISCAPNPFCLVNNYDGIGSGGGLAEFGNTTGALDLTKDAVADNGATNGYGTPVLDAYVGTDDPPTGPLSTPGTNLADASQAATGSAATAIDEVTVPALQAPVAQLLSLPVGLTIGCTGSPCVSGAINMKNSLWQEIWSNTVPKTKPYAANTWGAVLELAGLHLVASNPNAGQFTDTGGAGGTGITLNVRTNGSGTSYTFKGALNLSGAPLYTSAFVTDNPTWPVSTTAAGSSGSAVAQTTEGAPGSVTYANLADATGLSAPYSPYTNRAQTVNVSGEGNHQILYAQLQDNWCGTGSPTCGDLTAGGAPKYVFANPAGQTAGVPNVYTGNNININGANPNFVGHWNVPESGGTFDPTGSWGGTLADDPDVYDHTLHNGVKTANYPIVAVTYELGWTDYDEAGSNLVGNYGGGAAQATAAGNSAISFLKYVVAAGKGQANLTASHTYYGKLPATIDGDAVAATNAMTP